MLKEMDELSLRNRLEYLESKLKEYKEKNLNLNMARGKPCTAQLKLSDEILKSPLPDIMPEEDDIRNYGNLQGLIEIREIFEEIIGVPKEDIFVGCNSSLMLEYNILSNFMLFGALDSSVPWKDAGKLKFLCPSPGYDRHFYMAEKLGFELITVKLNEDGPDMDEVESLVAEDESIKGIWCIPKYSNPCGCVFSDEVIERLAKMTTKAEDFTIMWDNAYAVHDFYEDIKIANIVSLCKEYDHPNRAIVFTSLSKVTFAGSSVAVIGTSKDNLDYILDLMGTQIIGSNKINQYLHIQFIKDYENLRRHMRKHMDILVPKFDETLRILDENIGDKGIAEWTRPRGGYFISLDLKELSAKKVVALCDDYGLKLTPAGATFPYGIDPDDKNIRIAPSFPNLDDLRLAMEVFVTVVEYLQIKEILL